MNQKALKTLEFDKIIAMLTDAASSAMGREKCKNLLPSSDIADIERMQSETEDAVGMLLRKGSISFGSTRDIRASLKRLAVGSSLNTSELLQIASLLENTARAKSYGRDDAVTKDTDEDTGVFHPLAEIFNLLEPLTPLSTEIRRCIVSEDEISDDASPALRKIRRSIGQCEDKIHHQLSSYINGPLRNCLQEAIITMRNGRYTLPVRAEYKSSVPGMVHDQSSTGATLFIEPMSVVQLNNDIRELELQEKKEIDVILAELSANAAEYQAAITYDLENMTELDFIFARAHLALNMKASRPVFNTRGYINLRKARHPLIEKHRVVPIDIHLGDTFHLLIVTGPNTGGKTVSLKTMGLFTIMGQCGLQIPALNNSELAVFDEIYADIGDEQSIEQSLSTFSSHMTHIVSFLEKATPRSLVLFDELGAGTDPTEGAALAIAILSYLHKKNIRTMATTHYSELKVYALSTEGVENASCEFNIETLRPTYRLLIGVPGKSNAFAISGKLGLPEHIIDSARDQIDKQDESFEDVLSNLEHSRLVLEEQRSELQRERAAFEQKLKKLESEQKTLTQQKERVLEKANEEAREILQNAKNFADQTMKDFRKFGKAGIDSKAMDQERNALREKINQVNKKTAIKPVERTSKELKPSDLHPGDTVKVLSMNLKGNITSKVDARGYVYVTMGIIRSKVHISDLELIDEPVIQAKGLSKTGSGKIQMSKSFGVSTEINLLGKTVDEALSELDKYLDDAYLAHLPSVRIIHGKGTGALRKAVQNFLRRQKHVKEFHLAEFGEGDSGVTIAKFK